MATVALAPRHRDVTEPIIAAGCIGFIFGMVIGMVLGGIAQARRKRR